MPTPEAGYAGATISELPSLYDGMIKLVRTELDISAFGVQIMDLAPDYTTQSHDESSTGQQELYVALSGSGAVLIGDERLALDGDHVVRVNAGTGRKLSSGPDGLRVLCVGGVPGAAYTPPDWTDEE